MERLSVRILLGISSGILLTLSFPKWNLFWFSFVFLIPLLFALRFTKSLKEVILISLSFGTFHFVSLLYWIVYTLTKYGQLNIVISLSLLILLSIYLSIYYVIPFVFSFKMRVFEAPCFARGLAFALFITGSEYLRSVMLTGFPWGQLGYLMTNFSPILQIADVFGIWGLTFVTTILNYFIFFVFQRIFLEGAYKTSFFLYQTILFMSLISLVIAYGFYSEKRWENLVSDEIRSLKIALLQGNIPQEIKETKQIEISFNAYQTLMDKALTEEPEIVLFPETAFNFYFPYEKDPTLRLLLFLEELKTKTSPSQVPTIVFGTFRLSYTGGKPKAHNSLMVWYKGDFVDFYDKSKLVPFGEYVPLGEIFPFLRKFSVVSDVIRPGTPKNLTLPLEKGLIRIAPLICFESAFSEILRERLKENVQLVYIATNDAWFGKTSAPYQHFQMAVVRAVEGRRFTVQVANTGISGIISPTGKILKKTDLEVQTYLIERVKPIFLSPYFRHTGNLLGILGALFLLAYGLYVISLSFRDRFFPKR